MGTFDNLFAKASPIATATPATGGKFDNLFPSKQTETPYVGTQDWNGQKIPANIPTKNLVAYDPATGNKTFNLGNAGPGVYTEDKNGNIVKGGHTTYGGVLPVKGSQRDDIIPQGLGGTNANAGNINLVPNDLATQQDKVETNLAKQVKSKQIQPKAAISQALREKSDLANNFFVPPEPTSTPASILKLPEKHFVATVGEGLDTQGQQNAKATVIRAEQNGSQPLPQTPTNMDFAQGARDLARMPIRAVAETTQSLLPSKLQQPLEPIQMGNFMRFLVGDETLKPLAQQAVEMEQQLKDQGFGKASTPLAIFGVSTNTALALSPLYAPLVDSANVALSNLAEKASTKSGLTITFSDAQAITTLSPEEAITKIGQDKYDAFKAITSNTKNLRQALQTGGIQIEAKQENTLSSLLKKITGEKPQEGVSYSVINPEIADNAPFAHELKPQAQLTTPKPEVAPFAHETPPPPEVKPFANEIKPVETPTETITPKAETTIEPKTETPGVQSKPAIEGQTPSKIGVSIEQKAVEQKLTQGFEGVAGYDKITIKDQAERATKLMSNPDEAMSVIRGEKPLPEGLRGTALITAAEEHIARTGDVKMAYELANSPLVSETSAAAQELRLAVERQPDGLTAKLQELKKAKEAAAQKRVGNLAKARTKIKADIQGEIKAKAPKAKDWASFIEQIKCT